MCIFNDLYTYDETGPKSVGVVHHSPKIILDIFSSCLHLLNPQKKQTFFLVSDILALGNFAADLLLDVQKKQLISHILAMMLLTHFLGLLKT